MHPKLVEDLLDPANYPPPRPSKVELRETHISWVFLTDTEAWKVKRPVRLGFVDYSTPERRRRFCEEEVRLNARTAPGVYRSVEPVRLDRRGHSFSRDGDAADYAVRMRRLPDEAGADRLLEAGRLGPPELGALSGLLARFYASAGRDPGYESPDVFRSTVEENFRQTEPFVGTLLDAGLFREVREWQTGRLDRQAAEFGKRALEGRIREGHGDLRLEHVYFLGGPPVVIDCIEFNAALRFVDAALDAAFLAMELDLRGRPLLAEGFLARFAFDSGDYGFLPLADLYRSYRAWVRGKVACFLAADPGTDPARKERKIAEARAHFSLARSYMISSRPPPRVIAVGGLIGTGKSTLAEALGWDTGWPVVTSDATRKSLAGREPFDPLPPECYSSEFTERTYREMLRRARRVLDSERGVILDATFPARPFRSEVRSLAAGRHVPFLFLELKADEASLRERLRKRAAAPSVSDAREGLLAGMAGRFEPVTEFSPGEHVAIETGGPPGETLRRARAALGLP